MYPQSFLAQKLYVADLIRDPANLCVSVSVGGISGIHAQLEPFRLFLEYKGPSRDSIPHLLDYAEIDWEAGGCFVKNRKRLTISILTAPEPTTRRLSARREGGAQ